MIIVPAGRAQELARIGDVFGDPQLLARYYIQPSCQHHNPADRHEDQEPMAQVRQPAFEVIDAFLRGDFAPLGDGRTQLFILSCRTQFFPETAADAFGRPGRVQVGGYTCPMVFLSLFDDDQVDAYLRRRFPDTLGQRLLARDNPVRVRAAAVVRSMESLRFRPLLLAHIQDIMEAGEREWDSYTLYEVLVDRWLAREEVKLRRQLEKAPDKATLWRICAAVASHLQASGNRLLRPAELDALVERFPAVAALEHYEVQIVSPFALGRFPVTLEEYGRFCEATGYAPWKNLGRDLPDAGRDSYPAHSLGFDDAVAYCGWLSRETGQVYRLPTELSPFALLPGDAQFAPKTPAG